MASLKFTNVFINDFFTIVGPKEKEGKIKKFDMTIDDYYFEEKTFELAEIKMQKTVLDNLLKRNKLKDSDISLLIGGELSNQLTATTYNIKDYNIPVLGVYSACASYVESLIILSNMIDSNQIKNGIVLTSSHNLTSEKQFRFPIEYGTPKPAYTTFTATGSVGNIVSSKKSNIKIESATIGKVIDFGIKDAANLGAVMAPAAADVILNHLLDLNRKPEYYDLILTGDLGENGKNILHEFLKRTKKLELHNHIDAACEIYNEDQNCFSGASGPVALPITLWNKIIKDKKYKKILIVGTGAMHSPIMCNQKQAIPAIAHAVSLEVQ